MGSQPGAAPPFGGPPPMAGGPPMASQGYNQYEPSAGGYGHDIKSTGGDTYGGEQKGIDTKEEKKDDKDKKEKKDDKDKKEKKDKKDGKGGMLLAGAGGLAVGAAGGAMIAHAAGSYALLPIYLSPSAPMQTLLSPLRP